MILRKGHKVPKTPTSAWEDRTGQKPIHGLYIKVDEHGKPVLNENGKFIHMSPSQHNGRWWPVARGAIMNSKQVRSGLSKRKQRNRSKKKGMKLRWAKERRHAPRPWYASRRTVASRKH